RLGTLPPTLVVTAEHDPLRDEGEHLAVLLAEAGVEVVSTRYQGQVHGFWRHVTVFPAAEALLGQVAAFLGRQSLRVHP
ncbi:MAG: nlhH 7, partial [Nocardioides sp.]|nr:nlhH 7 [Nocardioides sp.]